MTWPHNEADEAVRRGNRIDPDTGERLRSGELSRAELREWLAKLPRPLTWDEYRAWAKTMTKARFRIGK